LGVIITGFGVVMTTNSDLQTSGTVSRWLRGCELKPADSIRKYCGASPPEDIARALVKKFCAGVWLEDADDFFSLRRRPVLYLANHQVAIESLLFVLTVSPLIGDVAINSVAKAEHAHSWLGQLLTRIYGYPGNRDAECVLYVPLNDGRAMLDLIGGITAAIEAKRCGLLVHVAGSRVLTCRDPVRFMSSAFLDLAIARHYPVVPLKFRGGLPVEPLESFIEFPVGYGTQEYLIGHSITPEELEEVRSADRRAFVLDRINGLGGPPDEEQPNSPDPSFKAEVRALIERFGIREPTFAVILAALQRLPNPHDEFAALLHGVASGRLVCPSTPEGQWLAGVARWLTESRLPVTIHGSLAASRG
jgi:hypothetical protein